MELFWTMMMAMAMTMAMTIRMIESSTILIVITRTVVTKSHKSYYHTRRLCRLHVI
jgi:hypothetical protein